MHEPNADNCGLLSKDEGGPFVVPFLGHLWRFAGKRGEGFPRRNQTFVSMGGD
jgi:hypothetical protein